MCKLLMQNGLASSPSLELVTIALLFALALCRLDAHLLVVLLQRREVFASLRKLALFHSFTDIPVHKRTLGVHEVELMVDAREDLGNGSAVADHAASAHHLGQITSWDHGRRLVVDATFESSRAPINKLNRALRLDSGDRGVHILGHDIPTVHHATSHVLTVARVALHEH